MSANLFSIEGDRINSYEDFKDSIRNKNISNFLFMPDTFSLPQGFDKYSEITFRAISFKNSRFERVKFVDCSFIGCLFLNAKFVQCEFSNCNFSDCNFLGSSWKRTRIDPKTLKNNFDYRNDANIAAHLFHALYQQYKNEHQPNYARQAKYLLMKARYGLDYYYRKKGTLTNSKFVLRRLQAFLHCLISGYGVYRLRVVLAFFLFLILASICNHLLQAYIFSTTIPPVSPNYSIIQSSYFTFISITTIGFGDMVPKSEIGRILIMGEASVGIILIAYLLNFFSERE
jgi:uncharacterized protein YjbI with pentapeptide repeats